MSINDLLSQDEIDALLHGVDDGTVDTVEPDSPPGEARPYDFASQDRIIRGRMPTLEMVNERFVRLWRIGLYGVTMAVGTLGAYAWAVQGGDTARAGTLAFTTFVLFQVFNVFNARAEHGSAFNAQFFSNGKLWLSLAGVLGLQVVAVHWPPAQAIFDTVGLSPLEWSVAIAIASTTLVLDEARKLLMCLFRRVSRG